MVRKRRGSNIFEDFVVILRDKIEDENQRLSIYMTFIEELEAYDVVGMQEVCGEIDEIFDKAYKEINPEYGEPKDLEIDFED